jgi:hypothetical protein
VSTPKDTPQARARLAAWRRRAGNMLLALYPEPWRERYRQEVLALIEDDPPGVRGLCSLLSGAADAHLRPQQAWQRNSPPAVRMRLSVGAVFCCWIAVSLQGASFQKVTEGQPFAGAEARHPLMSLAHQAILAAALLGAAAVAVAGLPLLWQALVRVRQERDWRLAAMLCLPPLAVAGFLGEALILGALAPARNGGFPARFVLSAGLPFVLGSIVCALVCALSPRAVLGRIDPSRAALRRAALASIPLALAMCVITLALVVYELSLSLQAAALAALSSGPLGASTQAMLAGECALAALGCAFALIGAARARRAALEAL